jgi:hypothetical protein
MVTLVLADFSSALRDEVEWKLEVVAEEDEERTVNGVFREIAEDIDLRDEGRYVYSAAIRREVNQILVRVGCLIPISDEEIQRRKTEGLGWRMRDFVRLDNQRYEWADWSPITPGRE